MVINTYRLLKSKYENYDFERDRNHKIKTKGESKKEENGRFKGTTFTYDYNG